MQWVCLPEYYKELAGTKNKILRSVYSTVTFAYVPMFWPNEFAKKLAIMESMTAYLTLKFIIVWDYSLGLWSAHF